MSIVVGDQVPLIPFGEIAGKGGTTPPLQNAKSGKPGKIGSVTSTNKVYVVAHSVGSGVKRYGKIPLTVLSTIAGDHVPGIPLSEVKGKTGTTVFLQNGTTVAKSGPVRGIIVTFSV